MTITSPQDVALSDTTEGADGATDREWWGRTWLPRRPLAADDFLSGVYRMARGPALRRRYVEANPQALSNLLVVDVDHSDAALRLLWDRDGWRPNVVV
ncbi:hypothetical protein FVA95_28850, partial [Pseudonocardia sp. EV170527-09]|uniref:replication initiation protein n=1 Tax=Pseudonocardia sp. EV170527-09 TaxID=2603411 RepID=UPI00125BA8BB